MGKNIKAASCGPCQAAPFPIVKMTPGARYSLKGGPGQKPLSLWGFFLLECSCLALLLFCRSLGFVPSAYSATSEM